MANISTEGSTNIVKGFQRAFEVIKKVEFNQKITQILFLSDGEDTNGNSHAKITEFIGEQMKSLDLLISVNSFGFGADYDELLLDSISRKFNGEFYCIDSHEILTRCLSDQLGRSFSIITEAVEIKLVLPEGLVLKDNLSKFECQKDQFSGRKYNFKIRWLEIGLENNIVCELEGS